jgi:serine/threonine protein kinase
MLSLRDLLHAQNWRETQPDKIIELFIALGQAADQIHARGVVHGDLSPRNVLVNAEAPWHPLLIDFGLARILAEPTEPGLVAFTKGYVAPEVEAGQLPVHKRSDLYVVGVLLIEALLGRKPEEFAGESRAGLAEAIKDGLPTALKETAVHWQPLLADILRRTTCPSLDERFEDLGHLVNALCELLSRWQAALLSARRILERPSNVAPPTACFEGREAFLENLCGGFQRDHIQWIHGLGGIGKTEVAQVYAARLRTNTEHCSGWRRTTPSRSRRATSAWLSCCECPGGAR